MLLDMIHIGCCRKQFLTPFIVIFRFYHVEKQIMCVIGREKLLLSNPTYDIVADGIMTEKNK
jgi:hypothetical protein